MDFSVLMSVYYKDNPSHFQEALNSITEIQTIKASEIILVVDGPIPPQIELIIKESQLKFPYLKPVFLDKNSGLGTALQIGAKHCSCELIARMDADDIALADRFKKQVDFLTKHPEIAVVGGQISEFIDNPDNIIGYRNVPTSPEECRRYFRDRDPLNHVTVMMRKSALFDVGNYKPWHLDEDTYLWGRFLEKGYLLSNLSDVLVNVRGGEAMYARRGGWKYFKSDSRILKWKRKHGLTSNVRFLYNYIIRFTLQVLMPNSIRGFIFKNMLRNKSII